MNAFRKLSVRELKEWIKHVKKRIYSFEKILLCKPIILHGNRSARRICGINSVQQKRSVYSVLIQEVVLHKMRKTPSIIFVQRTR